MSGFRVRFSTRRRVPTGRSRDCRTVRHVVEHRDHVTGVVAERVLSTAFRTGYWPADSGPFDDFLAAAADIVSR